jgi:hypothetical protein
VTRRVFHPVRRQRPASQHPADTQYTYHGKNQISLFVKLSNTQNDV